MRLWTKKKKKTAVKYTDTFLVYDNAEGVMQVDGSNVKNPLEMLQIPHCHKQTRQPMQKQLEIDSQRLKRRIQSRTQR